MHIGVDVRKFLNLFMEKIVNKYQFIKTFVSARAGTFSSLKVCYFSKGFFLEFALLCK